MVKNKKFIMLILQLGLMGTFVLGAYHFTQRELTPTDVYVFAKKMNKNAELELSDFKKVQVPSKAVTKEFLTSKDLEKIREGNMVVTTNVEVGQYAYKNQIGESNKVDPFEKIDLSKYRKISIPVSYETAMGGDIKRGDRVDLAYIGEAPVTNKEIQGEGKYSNVFMQNVLVYSATTKDGFEFVGHSQIKKSQISTGTDDETNSADEAVNSVDYEEGIAIVTIAVPIDKAEEILARSKMGEIRIVGRFEESKDTNAPGYLIGVNGNDPLFAGNKQVENS